MPQPLRFFDAPRRASRSALLNRTLLVGLFVASLTVLVAGIAASAALYPTTFDWRYQTVSSLLSRVQNPEGSRALCLALFASFSLLLPLPRFYRRRLDGVAPTLAWLSEAALLLGFGAAMVVALERGLIRNSAEWMNKGHEYVALVSFFAHLFGIAGFWICFSLVWRTHRALSTPALLALCGVSLGPMAGIAASQAYLYFVPNELGWVGPHWAALGVPLYLSFAFWEWLACAGVYSYLGLLLVMLPEASSRKTAPTPHPAASAPRPKRESAT